MSPVLPPIDGPRARAVTGTGRIVSGTLLTLGILGVLQTSVDDLGSDSAEEMLVFTVHPITGLLWLATGLVGTGMCVSPRGSRAFLLAVGPLLVLWAVLALAVGEDASQVLARDTAAIVMHLVGGAVSLLAAAAPLPGPVVRALEGPGAEPPAGSP